MKTDWRVWLLNIIGIIATVGPQVTPFLPPQYAMGVTTAAGIATAVGNQILHAQHVSNANAAVATATAGATADAQAQTKITP